MSPDLEWRIGEETEQDSDANTSTPRRSRHSWIAIVVIFGLGMGMVYYTLPGSTQGSLPNPWPTPTLRLTQPPTPTPPPMPAELYAVIDHEAHALAAGDTATLTALHASQDSSITEWERTYAQAWGKPRDNQPLYTIINYNVNAATAWADIRQFRQGRWFRQTRFYNQSDDSWQRSNAAAAFWSGQTATLDTPHFHLSYSSEDQEFAQLWGDQLEFFLSSLCADFGCADAPPTYTFRATATGFGGFTTLTTGPSISYDRRTIYTPSPRIAGQYEDFPLPEDLGLNLVYVLALATAHRTTYDQPMSYHGHDPLLWALSWWAASRAVGRSPANLPHPWVPQFNAAQAQSPLTLDLLWSSSGDNETPPVYGLAYQTVLFIEQEYGASALAHFLKGMRNALSFSDIVENGLGVPYAEFEQKWQAWLKRDVTSP